MADTQKMQVIPAYEGDNSSVTISHTWPELELSSGNINLITPNATYRTGGGQLIETDFLFMESCPATAFGLFYTNDIFDGLAALLWPVYFAGGVTYGARNNRKADLEASRFINPITKKYAERRNAIATSYAEALGKGEGSPDKYQQAMHQYAQDNEKTTKQILGEIGKTQDGLESMGLVLGKYITLSVDDKKLVKGFANKNIFYNALNYSGNTHKTKTLYDTQRNFMAEKLIENNNNAQFSF